MSESILKLTDVSLVLERRYVIRDITWEIERGEHWALIGPNGAGKTSLLSVINGYRWPTSGQVSVLGREFGSTDLRELRKRVGMVSSFLQDWIRGEELVLDIVLSGKEGSTRLWGKRNSHDAEEADSMLTLTGSLHLRDRRLRELSQGERQKVLISRAMMAHPELLTLDEPCAGLDLGARESFLRSLSRLMAKNTVAIIDVTHRSDEIPAGFTHALLLRGGRAVASGPIGKVLTAANLSRCFDVPVSVRRWGRRYYTIVQRE